jgi:hypothetical protein
MTSLLGIERERRIYEWRHVLPGGSRGAYTNGGLLCMNTLLVHEHTLPMAVRRPMRTTNDAHAPKLQPHARTRCLCGRTTADGRDAYVLSRLTQFILRPSAMSSALWCSYPRVRAKPEIGSPLSHPPPCSVHVPHAPMAPHGYTPQHTSSSLTLLSLAPRPPMPKSHGVTHPRLRCELRG